MLKIAIFIIYLAYGLYEQASEINRIRRMAKKYRNTQ